MGGRTSRDVVAKPSEQKGKSLELTTELDHNKQLLHRFSLRVIELEGYRVAR